MKPTLLVIDDEKTFRIVAEEALSSEGFSVITAASGQAGLAAWQKDPCDLVILDRHLPSLDEDTAGNQQNHHQNAPHTQHFTVSFARDPTISRAPDSDGARSPRVLRRHVRGSLYRFLRRVAGVSAARRRALLLRNGNPTSLNRRTRSALSQPR